MDITEHIINHFDFLCNEGFKCSIISNNLEECVTYEGHGCEIVITYDLREHIIDFGIIYEHGRYYTMIEVIYQNVSDFSGPEITEFEEKCDLIITSKNIGAILEWFGKFIGAHLRDLMKLP